MGPAAPAGPAGQFLRSSGRLARGGSAAVLPWGGVGEASERVHHHLTITAASAAEKKWRSTYYYGPGGRVGRPRRGSFLCLVLCGRWGVAARRELGRAHCISESPGRLTLLAADVGRASSGSVGPSGCCRGRAWWAGRTVRPKRALQAVQVWVQAGAAQVACGGPADVAQAFLAGRVEGARRQVLPV